jgi:hypothetical protein
MRVAGRAHVDRVDVVAAEQLGADRDRVRDIEFLCSRARAIDFGIGDGDDAAARVAAVAGEVRAPCPGPCPEHADANQMAVGHEPDRIM